MQCPVASPRPDTPEPEPTVHPDGCSVYARHSFVHDHSPIMYRSLATVCPGRIHRYCIANHTMLCEAEPLHLELDDQQFSIVCRWHHFFAQQTPQHYVLTHSKGIVRRLELHCTPASAFCSGSSVRHHSVWLISVPQSIES